MARQRRVADGALVLDARGIVRLAAGDPAVRALVQTAHRRYDNVVTAASTLAEVLRGGGADARIHRILQRVTVASIDSDAGRKAGELLGANGLSGHRFAADAMLAVVALAQPRPALLLTSDPDDMARLTEEPNRSKRERIAVIKV